jgi:hypothetical protein
MRIVKDVTYLVIQQLLPRLSRILGVRSFDDRIHGTALLAETTVDAFRHVDIVTRRAAAAVNALFSFDRNGLSGTDLGRFVSTCLPTRYSSTEPS